MLDEDGIPVEGARVSYNSQSTENKGAATAGKDGAYVSEPLPPTIYRCDRVWARHGCQCKQTVTVVGRRRRHRELPS